MSLIFDEAFLVLLLQEDLVWLLTIISSSISYFPRVHTRVGIDSQCGEDFQG